MSHSLSVYFNQLKVGRLWLDDSRRFQFAYDADWLANKHAMPLSLSLPLQAEIFADDIALLFFPISCLNRISEERLRNGWESQSKMTLPCLRLLEVSAQVR